MKQTQLVKTKILKTILFIVASPKAKRNKLYLCKQKVLLPSSHFILLAHAEETDKAFVPKNMSESTGWRYIVFSRCG